MVGLAVGYVYAYLRYYGLLESWHLVGNPGDDLAQIVGTGDGRELVVATEGGAIYGLEFHNGEWAVLPAHPTWVLAGVEPTHTAGRVHYGFADVDARRPGFEANQLYNIEYRYKVEGSGVVKFALDADGNLWMWRHEMAGLAGLVFYFYPVMGLVVGAAAAGAILGVRWFSGRGRIDLEHF